MAIDQPVNEETEQRDMDDLAKRVARADLLFDYKIRGDLETGEVKNWWNYRSLLALELGSSEKDVRYRS